MPKIIKKYKLESQFSNESEFEVTRVKQVETRKTARTDSEGYPISDRQEPVTEIITKYGITAISLPSRKPATVIPIEVEDVTEVQALMSEASLNTTVHRDQEPPVTPLKNDRPKPIRTNHIIDNANGPNGRPAAINLTKALDGSITNSVPIPKSGEVVWADASDAQGSNNPQPF
jgi:hypothetical protein